MQAQDKDDDKLKATRAPIDRWSEGFAWRMNIGGTWAWATEAHERRIPGLPVMEVTAFRYLHRHKMPEGMYPSRCGVVIWPQDGAPFIVSLEKNMRVRSDGYGWHGADALVKWVLPDEFIKVAALMHVHQDPETYCGIFKEDDVWEMVRFLRDKAGAK